MMLEQDVNVNEREKLVLGEVDDNSIEDTGAGDKPLGLSRLRIWETSCCCLFVAAYAIYAPVSTPRVVNVPSILPAPPLALFQ